MNGIPLLEDDELYRLATQLFTKGEPSPVKTAQITGLLSLIRASGHLDDLNRMVDHQLNKAKKDDRAEHVAHFYSKLHDALVEVRRLFVQHAQAHFQTSAKLTPAQNQALKPCLDQMALTFMTHVAAEHRWRGEPR